MTTITAEMVKTLRERSGAGMFLVLSLMVFVTWNDITRNITNWLG